MRSCQKLSHLFVHNRVACHECGGLQSFSTTELFDNNHFNVSSNFLITIKYVTLWFKEQNFPCYHCDENFDIIIGNNKSTFNLNALGE